MNEKDMQESKKKAMEVNNIISITKHREEIVDIAIFKESDRENLRHWFMIEKSASTNNNKVKVMFVPDSQFKTSNLIKGNGIWEMTKDGIEFYFLPCVIMEMDNEG